MSQIDYTAFAGDTIELIVDVVDEDGEALDVTGASVTYAIAQRINADALVTKTTGDGITIDGAEVTITLLPADTVPLIPYGEILHHECEIVDAGGNVGTVLYGNVRLRRTVINA